MNTEESIETSNYTNRVVAFVDILGFRSKVEDSISDKKAAKNLHSALQSILGWQIENEEDEILSLKEIGREITVFSDSIVISYSVERNGGLFYILMDLIHLQIELMAYGLLLRGGISLGQLYHDGKIVYGPAMVEAYELESKKAIYPRIIISEDTLVRGIKETLSSQNSIKDECGYIDQIVKKDKDGFYFLDILRQDSELSDTGGEYYLWLIEVRNLIIREISKYEGDIYIMKKYRWLTDYYNKVVTDKKAHYPILEGEGKSFRAAYTKLEINEQAIKKLKDKSK